MTKDEQIEEMAVLLTDGGCVDCKECSYNNRFNCRALYEAELLYNAGYRKAEDVAREVLALIWDAYQTTHYDSEFEERFDKIAKKY